MAVILPFSLVFSCMMYRTFLFLACVIEIQLKPQTKKSYDAMHPKNRRNGIVSLHNHSEGEKGCCRMDNLKSSKIVFPF